MPKMTPALAKNTLRRALRAIVDPEPPKSEIAKLWEFFKSACAYCGRNLSRNSREGHLDHLVHTGPNHISNRVLACSTCNGDEKRDLSWLPFLKNKVRSRTLFKFRYHRIRAWINQSGKGDAFAMKVGPVDREIEKVIAAFDGAVTRLRRARIVRAVPE